MEQEPSILEEGTIVELNMSLLFWYSRLGEAGSSQSPQPAETQVK